MRQRAPLCVQAQVRVSLVNLLVAVAADLSAHICRRAMVGFPRSVLPDRFPARIALFQCFSFLAFRGPDYSSASGYYVSRTDADDPPFIRADFCRTDGGRNRVAHAMKPPVQCRVFHSFEKVC
jgi:hypothetical protein